MTEELGLGLEETASVDMLPGGGGCDSGSRPMARAGLEARSHRRSWTHTCCLLLLPILTGLFTYLFVSQLWAQGEDCVLDQIPKEKEFLPSHQRAYILPSRADGGKPRAHLTVIKQPPTHPSKNQLQAMHWEHELGLAFTKNRMNYTNKFLVVPESGDYFIYTQITFRGTSVECGDMGKRKQSKPDSIIVVITKVTDRYPEPSQLLMGTKSVCEISGNWFQPLYLGAMFSLQEGDKLMVNVSDISLVDYTREDKTFFGAFLL